MRGFNTITELGSDRRHPCGPDLTGLYVSFFSLKDTNSCTSGRVRDGLRRQVNVSGSSYVQRGGSLGRCMTPGRRWGQMPAAGGTPVPVRGDVGFGLGMRNFSQRKGTRQRLWEPRPGTGDSEFVEVEGGRGRGTREGDSKRFGPGWGPREVRLGPAVGAGPTSARPSRMRVRPSVDSSRRSPWAPR